MKKLAIALLVVVFSGCAAIDKKSDDEIYQAAIDAVAMDSGKVKPKALGYKISSSGMVSDQIVIGAGGDRIVTGLRDAFIFLRKTPNSFLVIMGENPSLDYAMISNAVKYLDLSGTHIVYSGLDAKQTQIAKVIKKTGALYYFIDKQKQRFKINFVLT